VRPWAIARERRTPVVEKSRTPDEVWMPCPKLVVMKHEVRILVSYDFEYFFSAALEPSIVIQAAFVWNNFASAAG